MTDRDLDALVARAFGHSECSSWTLLHYGGPAGSPQFIRDAGTKCGHAPGTCFPSTIFPPSYSTRIDTAFNLVVEAMRAKGWGVRIARDKPTFHKWVVAFSHATDPMKPDAIAAEPAPDKLPRALCVAALKALGVEVHAATPNQGRS